MSPDGLRFLLPGRLEVPVFGIWGGDGAHMTADGWKLAVIYPLWPCEHVVIWSPWEPGRSDYFEGARLLRLHRLEDHQLRVGFAPSGRKFMILGSAGAEVYTR